MTPPDSQILQAVLRLEEADPGSADAAFTGTTGWCPWPKAYGGDMVAQAMVAAMRSVDDERWLHSMHSYFMRPVDIGQPVRYEVEALRDGRGYSTRQVRALQNGKVAYLCLAGFHVGEDGPSWPGSTERVPTDPDQLPTSDQVLAQPAPGTPGAGSMSEVVRDYWAHGRSADMRHDPGTVFTSVEGGNEPEQDVWLRSYQPLDAAPGLTLDQTHQAALAWLCDFHIIEPSLRAVDLPWATPGLMTASLDHAMWFHRPARVDQWLRYHQASAFVGDGRALGLGRFHTADGELVATLAQEASIRLNR